MRCSPAGSLPVRHDNMRQQANALSFALYRARGQPRHPRDRRGTAAEPCAPQQTLLFMQGATSTSSAATSPGSRVRFVSLDHLREQLEESQLAFGGKRRH
jgi:hypothetical protein